MPARALVVACYFTQIFDASANHNNKFMIRFEA